MIVPARVHQYVYEIWHAAVTVCSKITTLCSPNKRNSWVFNNLSLKKNCLWLSQSLAPPFRHLLCHAFADCQVYMLALSTYVTVTTIIFSYNLKVYTKHRTIRVYEELLIM